MSKCAEKVCPAGKICNPMSARCVDRHGKIGKTILSRGKSEERTRSRSRSPGNNPCPAGKIINPKSQRCVKTTGKIGMMLLAGQSIDHPLPTPLSSIAPSDEIDDIPTLAHPYGSELDKVISPGYRLIKFINKGSFGATYLACKDRYTCRVYKIQLLKTKKDKNALDREVEMQKKFASYNLAPKIYNFSIISNGIRQYGVIEMDRISGTLDDILEKKLPTHILDTIITWVGDAIEVMCSHGLIHADFHWSNIGFNLIATSPDADSDMMALQLMIIDFGWSCCKNPVECIPELELSQLLRTASIGHMNKANQKYLEDRLLELYRENYNPKLADNIDAWDAENKKWFNKMNEVSYNPRN